MIQETEIEELMAEIILGVVKNPVYKTNVEVFCNENHIDRHKLTSKKMFKMKNGTLFRVMMGIAQLVTIEDYLTMCFQFALITYCISEMEDGTPEAIKLAHTGSPIDKKNHCIAKKR